MSSLSILFVPLDATGHINACIGISEQLIRLGHRVTFALEQAWKGKLKSRGFDEVIYTDPSRDQSLGPNDFWVKSMELIEDTLHRDSLYKAGHQNIQEFDEFIMNELNFDDQLEKIIAEMKPDIIVVDNYFTVPAVYNSGRKWVQMSSANPLSAISDPNTPPAGSGYPVDGDRAQWKIFEDTFINHHGPIIEKFEKRIVEMGVPPLPEGSIFHPSPYLNIYAYPEELDYLDIRPLPPKWQRFDHFIRESETKNNFELPEKLQQKSGKLVYVSMGSMGGSHLALMQRLADIFGRSPHRFLMVLGPSDGKVKLADNIFGQKYLPQVEILPHVDLVISHGGNNSVLESLYNGKPLIINPLFADQYDNAQRITEKGYGSRINAYTCDEEELLSMIDRVLADQAMAQRCKQLAQRMQTSKSTERAARAIAEVATAGTAL